MSEHIPRLYADLAWLWPLWGGPAGEYAVWCEQVTQLIRQHSRIPARSILNMGCGGGKNAFNLKKHFEVTGIDVSQAMLELAKRLNPESMFVHADMRTCQLGRQFDCILIDDAVSYMTSQEDLGALFGTAWRHLRPGGVMIVSPDQVKETFQQNCTHVFYAKGSTKPVNIDVGYITNAYDPDPADETLESTHIYLIRQDGRLRVETDEHLLRLFALDVWRALLRKVGFEIREDKSTDNTVPTFACTREGQSPVES